MTAFSNEFLQDLPPKERRYDTPAAENLVFSVFPNGVKAWVHVYSYEGFVRRRTIGLFPEMDYAQAQAALSQSRRIVAVEMQQGGQRRQPAGMSPGKLLLLVSAAVVGGVVVALMIRSLTTDGPAPRPEPSAAVPAETEQTLAVTAPASQASAPTEMPGAVPGGVAGAPPEQVPPETSPGIPQTAPDSGITGPLAGTGESEAPGLSPGQDDAPADAPAQPQEPGSVPDAASVPGPQITPVTEPPVAEDDGGDAFGEEATAVSAAAETGPLEEGVETIRNPAGEDPETEAGDLPSAEGPAAADEQIQEEQEGPADPVLAETAEAMPEDPEIADDAAAGEEASAGVVTPDAEQAEASLPTEDGPTEDGPTEDGPAEDSPAEDRPEAGVPEADTGETTPPEPAVEVSVRAQLTSGLADMEPTDELASPIMVAAESTRRVYFFTEARGMFGSRVTHRWRFEGTTLTQLPFVVAGDPWPVYSSKDIPAEQAGNWEVSIVGEDGKVLASESFQVGVEAP